ncbi:MAG: urease accessory protein UreD, partial [Halomonas campaniensis]
AVEALRQRLDTSTRWAATGRHGVLLLRYLGQECREAWALCEAAWRVLRPRLLGREACVPRIWRT